MFEAGGTSSGITSLLTSNNLSCLLLLCISGDENKGATLVNLITVFLKPEETCKQGCLLSEPDNRNIGVCVLLGSLPVLVHRTHGLMSHPKGKAVMVK